MNDDKKPVAKTTVSKTKKEVETVENKELTVMQKMIKEINETTDKVLIDGRTYTTVAKRLEILRKHLADNVRISTKHLHVDDDKIIFRTKISLWEDGKWKDVATGHAEEKRNATEINKKAALENAETSSIGRALANFGLSGGEFASINEVSVKTGLISKADVNVLNHLKALLKQSGLSEKAVLASLNVSSFDMLKEEDAFKIIKQALASIANKEKKNAKPSQKAGTDEEEIKL